MSMDLLNADSSSARLSAARLKRLAGRSSHQVNRLDAAVASQNMKNPTV
jgi:hypothetical protein